MNNGVVGRTRLIDVAEQTGVSPVRVSDVQIELLDATHDSGQVKPGWLFCAVRGANIDGHRFATQAVANGASALLVEKELNIDIAQFVVADTRQAMGTFAAAIHRCPSHELTMVGVTGTNGKSSFVQIMADIWATTGEQAETYGTVSGERTTPEATDLQRRLRTSADTGTSAVALEVSSHALSFGRAKATEFDVVVFTNLSHDHLDFHGTVEEYFAVKATLFDGTYAPVGVINIDDDYGRRLHETCLINTVPYTLADAQDLTTSRTSTSFRWRGQPVTLNLVGKHNVSNALAAATVASELGVASEVIADGLCRTSPVRGRFEFVDVGQPFSAVVDYAHTPEALRAALAAARSSVQDGRVILVFGCGGDRDTKKRPEMGRVAENMADQLIVTTDNPRSENPEAIADDIVGGMSNPTEANVEPDRAKAIAKALRSATPGDLVMVAGKGHETKQIVGDTVTYFDDRQVILQVLGVDA